MGCSNSTPELNFESLKGPYQIQVEYILSPERYDDWQILRESMGDPALLAVTKDNFTINMQAAYLQLLGGALARVMGGPEVIFSDPFRGFKIFQQFQEVKRSLLPPGKAIDDLEQSYNSAYGSSSTNGVDMMAKEFNRIVASGAFTATVIQVISEHFSAVWVNFYTQLGGEL